MSSFTYSVFVSSQKFGAKKTDHSDESRPEAPSFPNDQRSQTTLPRIFEMIPPLVREEFVPTLSDEIEM